MINLKVTTKFQVLLLTLEGRFEGWTDNQLRRDFKDDESFQKAKKNNFLQYIKSPLSLRLPLIDPEKFSFEALKSKYSGPAAGAIFTLDLETGYYPELGLTEMEGIRVTAFSFNECDCDIARTKELNQLMIVVEESFYWF